MKSCIKITKIQKLCNEAGSGSFKQTSFPPTRLAQNKMPANQTPHSTHINTAEKGDSNDLR